MLVCFDLHLSSKGYLGLAQLILQLFHGALKVLISLVGRPFLVHFKLLDDAIVDRVFVVL